MKNYIQFSQFLCVGKCHLSHSHRDIRCRFLPSGPTLTDVRKAGIVEAMSIVIHPPSRRHARGLAPVVSLCSASFARRPPPSA